jgi:hypothetical protein
MEKYGFETYLDSDIFPEDFASDNCNKVFVDVLNNSTMFITKVTVVLKDCKNNVLFTSEEGKSKEKEYKVAYNQALREAFNSFNKLQHKYVKSEQTQKSLGMIGEPAQTNVAVTNQTKTSTVQDSKIRPKTEITSRMDFKEYSIVATENGFNLITPVSDYQIFQIFKTSSKDIFIAKRDLVSGVLIKKVDNWYFEYYDKNVLKSELIKLTF